MKINPLFLTDAYKLGHAEQYPEGTTKVYSNWTPRSLSHSPIPKKYSDEKVVFFGLQGTLKELKELWQDNFFSQDKDSVCKAFGEQVQSFVGPNGFNTKRIEDLHDLGYLPIRVRALKEGSKVYPRIPMMTIENTIDEFFWITNYLETVLSTELWKQCTVATIANSYRTILKDYANSTGGSLEFVDFQAHDFSSRGLSGWNDMLKVGSAHLTSFLGSDTIAACPYLDEYYNAKDTFKAASVPATEHSVMAMGQQDNEINTFRRLINDVYPNGIVSIVSDTWDFWQVVTKFVEELKEDILNRGEDALGNSKVVIRPDSGDPVDIICGTAIFVNDYNEITSHLSDKGEKKIFCNPVDGEDVYLEGYMRRGHSGMILETKPIESTPEMKGAIECLWDVFNGSINDKGYKTLNSKIGLIYGDSITLIRADTILKRLKAKGFASDNVVLGIGSYSYQYITRDTFGFAMKATFGVVNGEDREIFKLPKTGDGTKNSAKGLLYVGIDDDNEYYFEDQVTREKESQSELEIVFEDGEFIGDQNSLESIRSLLM